MSDRIRRIVIVCERCGDKPLTELLDQSELGKAADWRHFQAAPWGHGKTGEPGGIARWYQEPTPEQRLERSHTDPVSGSLHLICNMCGNRETFTRNKWEAIAASLAAAGQTLVSIAGFRAIAQRSATTTRRSGRHLRG